MRRLCPAAYVAGICLVATLIPASARPVRSWTPEELAEKAQVICTGTPMKIDVTDQRVEIKLAGNDGLPGRIVVAKIKVLTTTKGKIGSEIEMRFPTLDYKALEAKGIPGVFNGPTQIGMEVGQRYRFYLNAVTEKPWFVGALDGDFDDGDAVQKLDPREALGQSPLLKAEAIQLASQYIQQRCLSFKIVPKWIDANYSSFSGPPVWKVRFYEKEPLSYPSFTSGAEIIVKEDRSIDSDSWIALGPPATNAKELIGKRVRVSYERPQYEGNIVIVRGRVEKVTDTTLTLHCSAADLRFQPQDSPQDKAMENLPIPSAEIRGISVLQE